VRVLFTIADLQPESGGPSRSVSALAGAVADLGVEAEILALDYGNKAALPLLPQGTAKVTLVPCHSCFGRRSKWSPRFYPTLVGRCRESRNCVFHDNGLWLPTNHLAARAARSAGVPFIISPRGMLTPWSLHFHWIRKRLAWAVYQKRDLLSARVLHATSNDEAQVFRNLGFKQPIAVIPNGVELPRLRASATWPASATGPNLAGKDPGPQGDPPLTPRSALCTALFLSRIHPKKGLLDLVEAWATVRPRGWRMVVAGGDENGHRTEVETAIRDRGLANQFEFIGEVGDDKKWEVYRQANLFILPSKSENFGIVIAEALACGLPVITTRATPWEELETQHCGWWVETGPAPLADALRQATGLSNAERQQMGALGRTLVEANYTWPAAAQKMLAVYRWMLGELEKPACVQSA